jgi:hypothetical protein
MASMLRLLRRSIYPDAADPAQSASMMVGDLPSPGSPSPSRRERAPGRRIEAER